MILRKRWLECTCGFTGPVYYGQRPPDHCPDCQPKTYRQLKFIIEQPSALAPPACLPAGWEQLTSDQRARVEQYIATLLAEQPRLF